MATTPTGEPATGVTSTSFWTTVGPMLGALGVTLYVLISHRPAPVELGTTISTGALAVVAIATKIWHDIQRRNLASGASDAGSLLTMIESLTQQVAALSPADTSTPTVPATVAPSA